MRAKPIKALELIYPMIQLFIKNIYNIARVLALYKSY